MLYETRDGKIQTSAVEYSVAYHCNLRCLACSHMSPFINKQFPQLKSFERDVSALSKVLHAKDIRLLGGEPLQNPEIVDYLRIARRSGIADVIMVTTNGLLLQSMKDEFWENVDFIWLSIYPGVSPTDKALERIKRRAEESNTRIDVDHTTHFRATLTTEPHPADWVTDMIFKTCQNAHRFHCHMIHEGRLFKCSCPPFLPEYLTKVGRNSYSAFDDAFDIHGATDLFSELWEFLVTNRTLDACQHCLGHVGKWVEHRQLTKEEVRSPKARHPQVTRASHLSKRKFAQESLFYVYRRAVEKLTGKRQW
jgi:hypothetical protein